MSWHFTSRSATAVAVVLVAGCTLVQLRQETQAVDASTVLAGRVEVPAGWNGPVCVSALDLSASPPRVAHQAWLHEGGGFELIVPRGRYAVAAFGDANGNGRHDAGEPAGTHIDPVTAETDGVVMNIDLRLTPSTTPEAAPPWPTDRPRHSTQAGAVVDLDDPAFSVDNGLAGYWAPLSFFREYGGNVAFVEPYDPARMPVLFVHGAAGSPQDLRPLIRALDRRRFQAWVFHYPSGSSLEAMAHLLYWKLLNLQLRHRFETLHIVAHSMGGLVVRRFVLDHGEQFPQLGAFITLSTPWAGEATAELGVQRSPAVVPSWRDMRPDGAFLASLFARRLPPTVHHYLLFSHRGTPGLTRPNNDGSVTLASQLRAEAQAEARWLMGFDEDHTSILTAPAVTTRVTSLLDGAGTRGMAAGAAGARIRVRFEVDARAEQARGLPVLTLVPVLEPGATPRAPLIIPLGADDSGRLIGPVPAGSYDVSLVAEAFASAPRRRRLQLSPDQPADISVRLTPQGTLAGYVAAEREDGAAPAGTYRAPHAALRITAIELSGAGQQRRLTPRGDADNDSLLQRYIDGDDAVQGAQFSFVGLPEGEYTLCIDAVDHQRQCTVHRVTPGVIRPFVPMVLARRR